MARKQSKTYRPLETIAAELDAVRAQRAAEPNHPNDDIRRNAEIRLRTERARFVWEGINGDLHHPVLVTVDEWRGILNAEHFPVASTRTGRGWYFMNGDEYLSLLDEGRLTTQREAQRRHRAAVRETERRIASGDLAGVMDDLLRRLGA